MESIESKESESVTANTETIQEDTAGTLDEEESPELD